MTERGEPAEGQRTLAIICGGGVFPSIVADAAVRSGRRIYLLAVHGWADRAVIERFPHHWVTLGRFGEMRRVMQAQGCRDVVFIGSALRPSIRQLWPDLGGMRFWLQVAPLLRRGGDNRLLSGIGRLFEQNGFRVLGAHEVAPEILAPEGTFGRERPTEQDLTDIARGFNVLAAIGSFDVGQAAVVAHDRVLALEAAEGTDDMLGRVAGLRREGRIRLPAKVGVLVKGPKPGQDRRFDLPAIGPRTVAAVAQAGLAGIAVLAGESIVAEPQAVAAAADRERLFIVGVRPEGTAR